MSLRLKNKHSLSSYLAAYAMRIERALIYRLEYMVAELENHAKSSKEYENQTSNLVGSIGGVVLKDGRPVTYRGFNDGGEVGNQTGLEFLNSLISQYRKGYVVLVVAGMEYATYVEEIYEKNVLKKTELKMQSELPKVLAELKRKIR